MSAIVSVVVQKNCAESMYPIGRERWKPTSSSMLEGMQGIMNPRHGMSSQCTQMCMYALLISTFDIKTGPRLGLAVASLWSKWWKVLPNWIALGGALRLIASFRPLKEKL